MKSSNGNQAILLFDLDGTLTDSGEGIFSCTETVLRHYHLPIPDRKDMRFMVGPPLKQSFPKFGVKMENMDEAISIYRRQYHETGVYQNFPYPGISELLAQLKQQSYALCLATSKPENMARVVLAHFGLDSYFEMICGASEDGKRSTKSDVIAYLLKTFSKRGNMIMVGDTIYDVLGAAEFSIPTIGVSWGYGSKEDMLAAGAIAIADNPPQLLNIIHEINRIE